MDVLSTAVRQSANSPWARRCVTLMGLGRHGGGLAAARYLAEQGAQVTVSDAASAESLQASLAALAAVPIHAMKCGRHDPRDFDAADGIVVNPAVRPDHPLLAAARARGAELTSEIEIFLRACPARVVGVTGSNGKSSTATMLAEIFAAAGRPTFLGGNIGNSLLDRLPDIGPDAWVVLELSSFQLAHLGAAVPPPALAVVTNCTPNHLDWHGDLAHYAAAKRRILAGSATLAVFNPLDVVSAAWAAERSGPACPAWPLDALPPLGVAGDHQRQNAALAAAAASAAGVDSHVIRQALGAFRGLEHRLQLVANVAGRRFINDSKATSPAATCAALAALEGRVWLLAGGVAKGADFTELAGVVARSTAGAALFGAAGPALWQCLSDQRADFDAAVCRTLHDAFAWCCRRSRAGDVILLSPGCASFDQFADYQARGGAFRKLVDALAQRDGDTA